MKLRVAFSTLILLSFAVMLMLPIEAPAGTLATVLGAIKEGNQAEDAEVTLTVEQIDDVIRRFFPVAILDAYMSEDGDATTPDADGYIEFGTNPSMVYVVSTWFGGIDYYPLYTWLGLPPKIFPGGENPDVPIPDITQNVYWKVEKKKVPTPGTYLFSLRIGGEGVPSNWVGVYRLGGGVVQNTWHSITVNPDFYWQDWRISDQFEVGPPLP
jgi:hypothetical protein